MSRRSLQYARTTLRAGMTVNTLTTAILDQHNHKSHGRRKVWLGIGTDQESTIPASLPIKQEKAVRLANTIFRSHK